MSDTRAAVVHWELCEQLRLAHINIDRLTVEKAALVFDNATLTFRVTELERENEAIRDLLAALAYAAGGGAVL